MRIGEGELVVLSGIERKLKRIKRLLHGDIWPPRVCLLL